VAALIIMPSPALPLFCSVVLLPPGRPFVIGYVCCNGSPAIYPITSPGPVHPLPAGKPLNMRKALVYWQKIVGDAVRLWMQRNAFMHAGALAFYTLFSLAPVLIIAVSIMGLVLGEEAAQGEIVTQLEEHIGEEAASAVEVAIAQSQIEVAGLLPTLFGIGAMVIGATTVFAQMQTSLNEIFGVIAKPERSSVILLLWQRLLSLIVILGIGLMLLLSLMLSIGLRALVGFADEWVPYSATVLNMIDFGVSFVIITLLFTLVYKILPDVVTAWRDILIGAAVTAILFAVGRYAIATYLAYTATASTYGAAGSLVLILLWVYYSSLILLFGAAFIRAHMQARGRGVVPRKTAVRVEYQIAEQA